MRILKHFFLCFLLFIIPSAVWATRIFTITPQLSALNVTQGTTDSATFEVKNTSGRTLTITGIEVRPGGGITATSSGCLNTSLANNAVCVLTINVTGGSAGSTTLNVDICTENGMECSHIPASTVLPVTVVAAGTEACSGASPTCRVFVTDGTYTGDLSQSTGDANVSSCGRSNPIGGVNRGNCICEAEAAIFTFTAPNNTRNPGHWKAWLSTNTVNAKDNIGHDNSITYITSSEANNTIASNGSLLSGTLDSRIAAAAQVITWTGTADNGTYPTAALLQNNCAHWISTEAGSKSIAGLTNTTNFLWTGANNSTQSTTSCNGAKRLYCFEKP